MPLGRCRVWVVGLGLWSLWCDCVPVVGGVGLPLIGRWSSGVGFGEPDPPGGMDDDVEASFVDDNLMVKPAEDDEVVLVGASSLHPGGLVVDLESIPASAPVGGTPEPVFGQQRPFQPWWSGPFRPAVFHVPAVGGAGGHFGGGVTEHRLESLTSHPDTCIQNHAGLTVGLHSVFGVDEHAHLNGRWVI